MKNRRILIVDDNEDVVTALALLFTEFRFTVINSRPIINKGEIVQTINHLRPDIIFLDHDLGVRDTGFDIIDIIPKNILVLSTSIIVSSSMELTDSYRNAGVRHFPGKTFTEIIKCINGNCGCYSPLISFLP